MTYYIVISQWPHREIACFGTLRDAQIFLVSEHGYKLAYPIIVSQKVGDND